MKILNITVSVVVPLLGILAADSHAAEVVAKYTFDGRTSEGDVIQRSLQSEPPFDGEDYVPDGTHGEMGPRLMNPGGRGDQRLYRSYYNNAASEKADGREVLEMKYEHPVHFDIFRTAEGEGPLPTEGSFTWEVICRIDGFDGTNHSGVLIDASKGAGRIAGYPGEAADKSINTRLWMKQDPANEGMFLLCFSVPLDDQNKCTTVSTELKFGEWYHIAAVYDEESQLALLYINGDEVAADNVVSAEGRSSGFAIGGYGPDVFRVDHILRVGPALFDAIAFSKGAAKPGKWALNKDAKE